MLDGNLENRCDVCLAKDAAFVSYPGLSGHVKSGCMSTPSFKSHYCKQHCERACKPGTDCQSRSNGDTDSKQHIPKISNHIFFAMQMLLCTIIHTYEYHSCMHAQTTLMKLL